MVLGIRGNRERKKKAVDVWVAEDGLGERQREGLVTWLSVQIFTLCISLHLSVKPLLSLQDID